MAGSLVVWNGPLAFGNTQTIEVRAKIVGPVANDTVLQNSATVGDGFDGLWTTNAAETTVKAADLSTSSKLVNNAVVNSGERITFTIVINNTGFADAVATMVDTLPAGLTLAGTPTLQSGPGSVIFAGNTVTWTGTLDYTFNNQARVQLSALVGTLSLCQKVTNTAAMSDGQGGTYQAAVTIGGPCYTTYMPIIRK
jgi:uncharacterized repeat protein (TIGR01451 family)